MLPDTQDQVLGYTYPPSCTLVPMDPLVFASLYIHMHGRGAGLFLAGVIRFPVLNS